jgi:molecular chaperone DnaJ
MPDDYYIILGIERGADLDEIKRAYRRAVKRYHPDTIESGTDSAKFREANQAYQVLSDTAKRRDYDARLDRKGVPIRVGGPQQAITPRGRAFDWPETPPSFLDAFFEGFVPGLFPSPRRHGPVPKDLYLEIILTPEEASRGGVFPVTVPVMAPCQTCEAGSRYDLFPCPACRGRGLVQRSHRFNLGVPPHVRHGTRVAVSLDPLGLLDTSLVVDVRVENHPAW